jgi:hypothetical protein
VRPRRGGCEERYIGSSANHYLSELREPPHRGSGRENTATRWYAGEPRGKGS